MSALVALVACAAALLLPGLARIDLWEPDEPRIAQVAEEMRSLEHGGAGLVLLHLNGEPYTQKPPLYYWLAALLGAPGGRVSETAARLPSALAGLALVALVAVFGARLLGPAAGLLGAALLLTVYRFAHLARRAQFDVLLALLETLALLGFWRLDRGRGGRRANVALLHGAMGLAVLTKGPVGFLIPMLCITAYLAWERRLRDLASCSPPWAFLLSLAPGLAWLVGASALGPEGFLGESLGTNVLGRFFAGTSHERPFYYYLYQLPLDFLPWTLLWPAVAWAGRRRVFAPGCDPERRRAWRFLLVWVGVSLLFFSLSAGKRGLYLLPTFPAAALLCADALLAQIDAHGRVPAWVARTAAGFGALLAGASAALVIVDPGGIGVPWSFCAAVVAAVVLAVLAWRALARAGRARRFGAVIGSALAVELAAFTLLYPALDVDKSPRPIAQAAAALTRPDEPVGLVGDAQKAPGFAYYGGRRIASLATPDDIRRFLDDGGRTLLVRRKKLHRVEEVTPVEIRASFRKDERRQFLVVSPRSAAAPGGGR